MLHLEKCMCDSASFILNGDSIFIISLVKIIHLILNFYFDIKLDKIMTMDEFEEEQAERRKSMRRYWKFLK